MNRAFFVFAVVATASAVGGFIIWFVDTGVANSATSVAGTTQALGVANMAFAIGLASTIMAVFCWLGALRYS